MATRATDTPGGGGGGATGEMKHVFSAAVTPGSTYAITVGVGGGARQSGGTTSFGQVVSAAGGQCGWAGGNEPLNNQSTANGGKGGDGGIGGRGGGAGRGDYSTLLGSDGANGTSSMAFGTWSVSDWYAFCDPTTGRRLGPSGGGGNGYAGAGSGTGGYTLLPGQGKTVSEAPGTCYGSGGRGGDNARVNTWKAEAGAGGLIAIRCWRYLQ